jgi:hypothetical protein
MMENDHSIHIFGKKDAAVCFTAASFFELVAQELFPIFAVMFDHIL